MPEAYVVLNISILDSRENALCVCFDFCKTKSASERHTDSILTAVVVEERWLPYILHSYRHAYVFNLTYRLCPAVACCLPCQSSPRNQCVQPDPIYTPSEVGRHTVMLSTPLPTNQIKSCVCVLLHEPACTVCASLFVKNHLFSQKLKRNHIKLLLVTVSTLLVSRPPSPLCGIEKAQCVSLVLRCTLACIMETIPTMLASTLRPIHGHGSL